MLNAQKLAQKINADWFVNGRANWGDEKVTVREIYEILVDFKVVSRSLGIPPI